MADDTPTINPPERTLYADELVADIAEAIKGIRAIAEAIRNRLNFFSTTPSPGKDSDDDVVHAHGARVHL